LLAKVEAVLGSFPRGAVQLVQPSAPALAPSAPMVGPGERGHRDGVAADLLIGDLTGDGAAGLLDGRRVARRIEQLEESGRVVSGGCGLYRSKQGRVCVHLDVSGEPDRWGAAAQPDGSTWPVRWSPSEQDAATRCSRLGLSPGEGSLRLVVRKRASMLHYDDDTGKFRASSSLTVWVGRTPVRSYPISLGSDPVGDKQRYGDGCTPEGDFYVCRKNPQSRYFRALQISYPNEGDAERGLRAGLITAAQRDRIVAALARREIPPQNTSLGRDLCIHGGGIGSNWTQGCVALTNEDMAELYELVPLETEVEIGK
jgi:lipoprotein-anchoring transpeptidase ErfK/SrfK